MGRIASGVVMVFAICAAGCKHLPEKPNGAANGLVFPGWPDIIICSAGWDNPNTFSYTVALYIDSLQTDSDGNLESVRYVAGFKRKAKTVSDLYAFWTLAVEPNRTIRKFVLPEGMRTKDCPDYRSLQDLDAAGQTRYLDGKPQPQHSKE